MGGRVILVSSYKEKRLWHVTVTKTRGMRDTFPLCIISYPKQAFGAGVHTVHGRVTQTDCHGWLLATSTVDM